MNDDQPLMFLIKDIWNCIAGTVLLLICLRCSLWLLFYIITIVYDTSGDSCNVLRVNHAYFRTSFTIFVVLISVFKLSNVFESFFLIITLHAFQTIILEITSHLVNFRVSAKDAQTLRHIFDFCVDFGISISYFWYKNEFFGVIMQTQSWWEITVTWDRVICLLLTNKFVEWWRK